MKIKVPALIVFALLAAIGVWILNSGKTRTGSQVKETRKEIIKFQKEDKEGKKEVRTIKIIAKRWVFEPAEIKVKKGEKVRLKITSIDVAHGFSLPEFAVNEVLKPGKEATVEFVADKTGRFSFFCSVQCGSGHSDMQGMLIVE